jgi:hypothetical protein
MVGEAERLTNLDRSLAQLRPSLSNVFPGFSVPQFGAVTLPISIGIPAYQNCSNVFVNSMLPIDNNNDNIFIYSENTKSLFSLKHTLVLNYNKS